MRPPEFSQPSAEPPPEPGSPAKPAQAPAPLPPAERQLSVARQGPAQSDTPPVPRLCSGSPAVRAALGDLRAAVNRSADSEAASPPPPPEDIDNNAVTQPLDTREDPDDDMDRWIVGQNPSDARLDDGQMRAYFLDPEAAAAHREVDELPPMDPKAFDEWVDNLDPAARSQLEEAKAALAAANTQSQESGSRTWQEVPEFYSGELPPELADRLGDAPYAIGFNQSGTCSADEAQAYLEENGGIDMGMYGNNFNDRFVIQDSTMQEVGPDGEASIPNSDTVIEEGYFGMSQIGRFVGAFPAVQVPPQLAGLSPYELATLYPDTMPTDFLSYHDSPRGPQPSLANKYVAAYIDDQGDTWQNNNFGISNVPDLQRYQRQQAVADNVDSDWL